jgi:hypothetical protein
LVFLATVIDANGDRLIAWARDIAALKRVKQALERWPYTPVRRAVSS